MTRLRPFVYIAGIALLVVTAACAKSPVDQAKEEATKLSVPLVNGHLSGPDALANVRQIRTMLSQVNLVPSNIGVDDATLDRLYMEAYGRDAADTLRKFNDTHAAPNEAEDLANKFLDQVKMSNKTIGNYGMSIEKVSQIVARNTVELIRKDHGQPSVAQLRAAGMKVPVIKPRTVRARTAAKPKKKSGTKPLARERIGG